MLKRHIWWRDAFLVIIFTFTKQCSSNVLTQIHSNHCEIMLHYSDVLMNTMASQITSLTLVYSTVYSGVDQRKHQSSASLAFVQGIHQWLVNSLHEGPVMRRMFPFDDVTMDYQGLPHWYQKVTIIRMKTLNFVSNFTQNAMRVTYSS